MQIPRTRSAIFSLFPAPFKTFDLVSMMELVCSNQGRETMARPWMAQG
jgi:hypothetical protein